MAEINLDSDLTQVNTQIEELVTQLNKLNSEREQLTQSIHNLNGIAMYLRGKVSPEEQPVIEEASVIEPAKVEDELERSTEYPVNTT